MGNNKTINFKDTNIPIIADTNYWRRRAVDKLRMSFDKLREAREHLDHAGLMDEVVETRFQLAGQTIMTIAKELNNPKSVDDNDVTHNEKDE